MIITGPDGKEKRKVKKQKAREQSAPEIRYDLDDITKPINMHNLPQPKAEESEDDDIFEGVGSNYNPLADLGDDDDDDDSEEDESPPKAKLEREGDDQVAETETSRPDSNEGVASRSPAVTTAKRDYFKSSNRDTTSDKPSEISPADATVRAALTKVRNLDENSSLLQNLSTDSNDPDSKEARLKKRAAELAASDRDMEDMDLGFGASRFDDAEEMEREGEKIKLSKWKGLGHEDDEDEGDQGGKGQKKRKRGGKKRKGDKITQMMCCKPWRDRKRRRLKLWAKVVRRMALATKSLF